MVGLGPVPAAHEHAENDGDQQGTKEQRVPGARPLAPLDDREQVGQVMNVRHRQGRQLETRLGRLGCRFSMDQVYSLEFPMTALTARKIRTVKIDADVLLAEYKKPNGDMQLRDVKAQLDRNSIDLIASKIETESQLRELLDLNIDFGQGYLFGEPRANWPLS